MVGVVAACVSGRALVEHLELDLNHDPGAVGDGEDGVDLVAAGIPVVLHRAAQRLGQDEQVMDDRALEKEPGGLRGGCQTSWLATKDGDSQGRVGHVDRGSRAQPCP